MTAVSRGRLRAGLLLCLALLAVRAEAGPFTPGNLVVYRVGSGTNALASTGNAVFLDEFTPAGVLVQTIALPTTASGLQKPLIASGTATTDGFLTRSANGNCLAVPGYGRDISITSSNITTAANIPRIVGRVSALGAIDTTTALADAAVGTNFRSTATADCSGFWVSGGASGIRFATLSAGGTTSSTDLSSGTFANTRALSIYGGQLYVSASVTALRGVATVGAGLPTSGAQTLTKLPGMTDTNANQPYAFFMADLDGTPGMDTIYVADDTAGTLTKFSHVGATWVVNGTVGSTTDAYRGLTGVSDGTTVTLYATRQGAELVSLVDGGGFNAAFGGTPTLLATAAANTAFRGVALAPAVTVTPSAGANGTISPSTPQVIAGGATTTFTVTADAGYAAVVGGSCGGTLSGNTFVTDPSSVNCTVVASFTQIPTFVVTPSAGPNGSIAPDTPRTLLTGTSTAFTITPQPGYAFLVGGTCTGSLAGNVFTLDPVTTDCTVTAAFTPILYTVTPIFGANGAVAPDSGVIVQSGQSTSFAVTPAPGYNVAVRGTCGGVLAGGVFTTAPVISDCTLVFAFAQRLVLFVGNSFTHGRVDPVLSYNAGNVTDLTFQMWLANPLGSNADEPHPWGGIPGIFKKLTDQAGLNFDVSISARSSATLRGHYLNSNPAGWDLRDNVASQQWDAVVLQDLSDEPLPAGRSANANLPYFNAYVDKFEAWIHNGAAETFTETQLFGGGSSAACAAITGASQSACDTVRTIAPANVNAHTGASVYLYETWARPDMIAPDGTDPDGQFYSAAEGIEAMTADFHDAYFGRAAANANIAGVSAVGDAFLRAVQDGIAMRDPYTPEAGKIDLWHTDFMHPSKYGSYLSALVHFATITGINPMTLGSGEQAASDLGIAPDVAAQLQRVAREVVMPDTAPPVSTASVSVPPNANGWNTGSVTVTISAADNSGGWGLSAINFMLSGAQSGSGSVPSGGAITISAEGETTISYFATDLAGNAEVPHALVIRIDETAPTLSVPARFSVDATGPAGASVSYHVTTADNSGIAPLLACVPPSGGTLPIGTNTVSCTATDAAGNASHASFTVAVSGAPAQTARLIAAILALRGINVSQPVLDLITAFLQRALSSGNDALFCTELSAFARQVTLLSGRGIPTSQAAQLVSAANQIRVVQACR